MLNAINMTMSGSGFAASAMSSAGGSSVPGLQELIEILTELGHEELAALLEEVYGQQ